MHTSSYLLSSEARKKVLKDLSVSTQKEAGLEMEERVSGFCITKAGNVRCGGGGSGGGGTGTKCGRWNPTTEQVKVLTDLFRSGLRTPSTDQIQKISTQLSFYGKIESKNVFYWFQNHKARERQKRRRVVTVSDDDRPSNAIRRDDNISSARYFGEISAVNHGSERVIETLQLFPLNSFQLQGVEEAHEKLRLQANECKEPILMSNFAYSFGTNMDHPPLDLRLSFCN